jgi:hypothetical protein
MRTQGSGAQRLQIVGIENRVNAAAAGNGRHDKAPLCPHAWLRVFDYAAAKLTCDCAAITALALIDCPTRVVTDSDTTRDGIAAA